MTFSIHDKKLAISRIPQSNYATVVTPAASSYQEIITTDNPGTFWTREARKVNNKGQSTGNRFATESHVEAWDSMLSLPFEASSQALGRPLLAVLGNVTTTTPSAGYYKHVFSPEDLTVSMQTPVYSFLERSGSGAPGYDDIWESAVCESLDLSGDGQGRVMASTAWRGSGKKSSGAGVTWASHVVTGNGNQNYFYNTQAGVAIEGVEMLCDLESWKWGYKNTFANDAGYRPGCPEYNVAGDPESGVVRTELLLVDSEITMEFMIRLQANDPRRTEFDNQTPLQIDITLTGKEVTPGNPHKLVIKNYLTKYNTHTKSEKDGIVLVTITPEVLYSTTDSKIVEVELYNNVASYTV